MQTYNSAKYSHF